MTLPTYDLSALERYEPPAGKPGVVLVDLDGTMCLREGEGCRSPYDESRVGEDAVNKPVRVVVQTMACAGFRVVFMSGRTEGCRPATEAWLEAHYILRYEALHMRAVGDTRKDWMVKYELFNQHVRDAYRVLAVFDDRNQVVRMWRAIGLCVLQVADGDF